MSDADILKERADRNAPTFSLSNRFKRLAWQIAWLLLARWTPPPLHRWRVALLNLFGARADATAHVYGSVEVWAPWNLTIRPYGSLARGVRCYNIAPIVIGRNSIVSQFAHLCTGTHDYRNADFRLYAKPITVGDHAWVCTDSFVGPGVSIGEGAVLGAAAVAVKDLEPWMVYAGNPAQARHPRPRVVDLGGGRA